ncbi:MAG: methylated-DNA--[protein]-cysteine S-methyltransferase [Gudongella sp.]|nr:methylated-DNA--[protein]-cysteine S-methyltransferase [Gudongella sp.]
MTNFAIYDFEFGKIKISYSDTAITFIKRVDEIEDIGKTSEISNMAFEQLKEYFKGKRMCFDFPYELQGTEFQIKVWKELCNIPYGQTSTYKQVATAIGNAKASRAVGMANNKNPLMIVVPCHRVVGTNNKLKGYVGGIELKKVLLDLEKYNEDTIASD